MKTREVKKVKAQLKTIEKHLQIANSLLDKMDNKKDYKDIPGIVGVFDGEYMVADSGERYKVPENYAAKSRLVPGDKLKMIEEDGKPLFKQVERVKTRQVRGVFSKKEGSWYVLTELGSYRILDVSANYNNVQPNDEAIVLVPDDNLNVKFAALEKVVKVKEEKPKETRKEKPQEKKQKPKPAKKQPKKQPQPEEPQEQEQVSQELEISFGSDDLR